MNNNYQFMGISFTQGSSINPSQLSHSFVRFPPQSSIMSVEEQNPQFAAQLAQSQIYIQDNSRFVEEEKNKHFNYMIQQPQKQFEQQTGHKRMSSWQQQQKSPQQQSQNKSLCTSPIRQQYRQEEPQIYYHQPYQPCPCELEQLWEEFLQMRMMQRQFRRQTQQCCHHQRGHFMPY